MEHERRLPGPRRRCLRAASPEQEDDFAAIRRLLDPVAELPPVAVRSETQVIATFKQWLVHRGQTIMAPADHRIDIEAV
ncbi:hypothetical protein LO763_18650 [Glycomyces sp. A-F 0318]|uniref:hypothetical protein n=1 Tax=Glycomyces amatae TaxID=2881355 RepID=UPI001E48D38E|nr:hypothetical protein [Glycomyces amatae]MCD0445629.1 hypothetical protein [Glycomyces amatae]